MFTKKFWAGVAERAVKTFCQAAVALLGGAGIGLIDVNWVSVVSVAGLATLVSVLTSVGSGVGFIGGGPTAGGNE